MSRRVAEARGTSGPSGLIDTIQTGFNTTNRHRWLLLIPLVVDLLLWFGPQLTMGHALTEWADGAALLQNGGGAFERSTSPGDANAGLPVTLDAVQRANLLWFLA